MNTRLLAGIALPFALLLSPVLNGEPEDCGECMTIHREWKQVAKVSYPDGRTATKTRLKLVTLAACDGKIVDRKVEYGTWSAPTVTGS